MTVSTTSNRISYNGDGVTVSFAFPYKFLATTDIVVYVGGVLKTLTTDYSVGTPSDSGATITMVSAPASGSANVVMLRNPDLLQTTELPANDPFPSKTVERSLDKLTLQVQRLKDLIGRAFTLVDSDTSGASVTISTPSGGKSLKWAADGLSIINSTYDPDISAIAADASASAASASASAASGSAVSAASSLSTFKGIFYGAASTDPTLDPNGAAMGVGDLYFNSVTLKLRIYTGSAWQDTATATPASFTSNLYSGNASTTAFTLSSTPASTASVFVFISGVAQRPTTDYSISGTTLTFVSAPATGTNNILAFVASTVGATTVADGTVTSVKMANGGAEFGMRNRIINGGMVIDQRNAGASVTPTVDGTYTVDRWVSRLSVTSKYSVQQNAGSITPPIGFRNYLGVTSLSAYTIGASESFTQQQKIEGFNVADLGWGTVNASAVTLSFKVYSSLTGTFGGSLLNSDGSRSYPYSYSIPVANTWTTISITIAGDTSGTWLTSNLIGLFVCFSLGVGATVTGTAGSWAGTTYLSATGATSVVGTSGATFYITGVQLEKGSTATGFDYRPYGTELTLCQRYYNTGTFFVTIASAPVQTFFPSEMRSTPTIAGGGTGFGASTSSSKKLTCSQTTPADQTLTFSAEL